MMKNEAKRVKPHRGLVQKGIDPMLAMNTLMEYAALSSTRVAIGDCQLELGLEVS